jgi:rhodanese-related sulfurtransferase
MTDNATIPDVDVIDVAGLQRLVRESTVRILDVRTGGEFESVHIPGSFNVPLDTLAEHVADLAGVEHPVVLVCQSGGRATQAHGKLRDAGKQRLHILEGGMGAWRAAGGDVIEGASGRWAMERQVRFTAGSIVLAGVLASIFVPRAKWLAGAVAGGLVFSAATDTCAMGDVLAKLPYNQGDKCDIAGVLDELRSTT